MSFLDVVRAAKASIKNRSSVPIFMARLGRLQSEGRAPRDMMVITRWVDWVAYLQKLQGAQKLSPKSYNTLSRLNNPVACGLNLVFEAPVAEEWTVIPILNKEMTDIKEIVVAAPANSNTRGLLMESARWRQDFGSWKLEGDIESNRFHLTGARR